MSRVNKRIIVRSKLIAHEMRRTDHNTYYGRFHVLGPPQNRQRDFHGKIDRITKCCKALGFIVLFRIMLFVYLSVRVSIEKPPRPSLQHQ